MKDLGLNHRAKSWCKAVRDWEMEFVTKTFRNLSHSLCFLLVFFFPKSLFPFTLSQFKPKHPIFLILKYISLSLWTRTEIKGFKSLFHRKKKTDSSNSLSLNSSTTTTTATNSNTNSDGGTRTSLQEIRCQWRRQQDLGLWIRIHHGKLRPPNHRGRARKDDCRGGRWRGWVYWPERVRGTEHKGCGFRQGHGESERRVFGLRHGWKLSHIGGRIAESDKEFGDDFFFFFFFIWVCVLGYEVVLLLVLF